MKKVLIIGAGGHGQVVADIFLAGLKSRNTGVEPLGYLDDDPELQQCSFLGLPVLGPIARLPAIAHDAVIVAVGDNRTRQRICRQLEAQGEQFDKAIHPSAIIGAAVDIAPGAMICAGVIVNPGSRLGRCVILNTGCTVDHHNLVADYAHIAPGAHLGGDVAIGEGTLIGIGATVMPQRRIGPWSIVGAGAVVTKDLAAEVTAVGAPARVVNHSLGTRIK